MVWKIKEWYRTKKKLIRDLLQVAIGIASLYWGLFKTQQEKAEKLIIREKYESAVEERRVLRRLVDEVVVKVVTDNYDINDIPLPMGYKIYDREKKDFFMVRINKAYSERYGNSNLGYFGKADSAADPKNGNQWYWNDIRVMDGPSKKVWTFYENTSNKDFSVGKFMKWKMIKGENEYLYFLQTE